MPKGASNMADEMLPEESAIQEDEILKQRTDKLRRLREEEGYDPFVHEQWIRKHTLDFVRDNFEHLAPDETDETEIVTAGRLMTLRRHGKASFANLADETSNIQLYLQLDSMGEEPYNFFKKWVDSGDMVGIVGNPCRTSRGELSILVRKCVLLAKALRPLPEKWHGLKDTETRYRQRYVDLIANPDVRDTFRKRARIISTFRQVLEAHGSIEVETPTLATLAGGANARPFTTFHNALGVSMYMRIATELYLKRLIVGMLGRVYEIGKNFRNEGIDVMHNPEFTCMEVYWAYANYEDIMNLTEELIVSSADAVGGRDIIYQGTPISLHPPFRRATMAELVKESTGFDIYAVDDVKAREFAKKKGLEIDGKESRFIILTELFETFVEEKLIQPTFVIGHPTEVSPLAKKNPDDPDFTNRFELYICGSEVANAFSELNDPLDQRERFMDQLKKKESGDEEAHAFDEDYINALEYGLPPTGGLGIGIDRLTMFLTDSRSIRDVILFPTMRPKA
ncbi:MAG: lysine--tRNA ligase [Thermovirga sp.]